MPRSALPKPCHNFGTHQSRPLTETNIYIIFPTIDVKPEKDILVTANCHIKSVLNKLHFIFYLVPHSVHEMHLILFWLMECSQCPTPTPIKNGLNRIVWRCSYWPTQLQAPTPTPTQMQMGWKPILLVSVSVSVSGSVNTPLCCDIVVRKCDILSWHFLLVAQSYLFGLKPVFPRFGEFYSKWLYTR